MSYLADFPHTTDYDQDLGWLIRNYKMLVDACKDLQARVKTLEELYDSIPDEIAKGLQQMQNQLNQAIANMQLMITTQLAEMRAEVDQAISDANDRMDALEAEITAKLNAWEIQFNAMVEKLNALYKTLSDYVDARVNYMQAWVKAYLEQWAQEYPYLIDPTDGKFEPLQEILFHMYNDLGFGIPAYQFDALEMSAQEFDDRKIPARCLDRWGRLLFRDWQCCRMQSPFTGEKVPISEVVLGLARLHQNAVTAGEFDDADLDVEMVDEKNVTAYDWDWTSVWFDEIAG